MQLAYVLSLVKDFATNSDRKSFSLYAELIFKVAIFKCEVRLYPLTPSALVVKENICSSFVVLIFEGWIIVSLEPCKKFLVISPALFLQFACS
mmetsp:Transcript_5984/g.8303  ORF Transcript_5984/g.8303 Transcript_5984/m.8303 type:complete len:93 (-) Transcript_5984:1070-1348(-)